MWKKEKKYILLKSWEYVIYVENICAHDVRELVKEAEIFYLDAFEELDEDTHAAIETHAGK